MASGGRGLSPGKTRLGRIGRGVIEKEPEYERMRVLVAESGDGSLQRLLAPLDVPVEAVDDARTLLERIRSSRPDLVLADLDAQHVNAVALLRALRRDRAIDNIPVILVGSREREAHAVAALAAGADDFLAHPVSPDVLHERIRYALAVAELIRRISAVRAELREARDAVEATRQQQHVLRHDAELAAELERVKRDFLNVSAHELSGYVAAALRQCADVEEAATAGDAEEAVNLVGAVQPLRHGLKRMSRLVDQMAATAVMEELSPSMDVHVVDLRDVVGSVVDAMRIQEGDAERLTVVSGERPLFVAVDEERIRDVVATLVENALTHSGEAAAVRMELWLDPDGHCATLAVREAGGEAPHGDGPEVVSSFAGALTSNGDGAPGMALLLGKAIARFHGGELSVQRLESSGTTTTLRLRLAGRRPRTTVLGGEVDSD